MTYANLLDILYDLERKGKIKADTNLIFFAEADENSAINYSRLDIALNGKCLQLFMYD